MVRVRRRNKKRKGDEEAEPAGRDDDCFSGGERSDNDPVATESAAGASDGLTTDDVQAALDAASAAAAVSTNGASISPDDAVAIAIAAVEPLPGEEEPPQTRNRRGRAPKRKKSKTPVAQSSSPRTTRSRAAKGPSAAVPGQDKKKRGRRGPPPESNKVNENAPVKKKARRSPTPEADDVGNDAPKKSVKNLGKAGEKKMNKLHNELDKDTFDDDDDKVVRDDTVDDDLFSPIKNDIEGARRSKSPQPSWETMFFRLVLYKARHRTTAVPIKFRDDGTTYGELGSWVARQRREYFKLPAADRRKYEKMVVENNSEDREYTEKADKAMKEEREDGEGAEEDVKNKGAAKGEEEDKTKDIEPKDETAEPDEIKVAVNDEDTNLDGKCDAAAEVDVDAVVDNLDCAAGKKSASNLPGADDIFGESKEITTDPDDDAAVLFHTEKPMPPLATSKKKRKGRPPVPSDLTDDRIAALLAVGFHFSVRDDRWEERYRELLAFKQQHGHCDVPTAKSSLGKWVNEQRVLYQRERDFILGKRADLVVKRKRGLFVPRITAEKREKLEAVGFKWRIKGRTKWEDRFDELLEFRDKHGHTFVPQHYAENKPLGKWVTKMRYEYGRFTKGDKSQITQKRVEMLEGIGFAFTAVKGSGCPNLQNRGRRSKGGEKGKDGLDDIDKLKELTEEDRARTVAARAEKNISELDAHRDKEAEKEAAFAAGEEVDRKTGSVRKNAGEAKWRAQQGGRQAFEDGKAGAAVIAQKQEQQHAGMAERDLQDGHRYFANKRADEELAQYRGGLTARMRQSEQELEDEYQRYRQGQAQAQAHDAGYDVGGQYNRQQSDYHHHQHHHYPEGADLVARAAAIQRTANMADYDRQLPPPLGEHGDEGGRGSLHPKGAGGMVAMAEAASYATLPLNAQAPAVTAAAATDYMEEEYGRGQNDHGPPPPDYYSRYG